MKKLFVFITCYILSFSIISLNATNVIVKSDLNAYSYAYVIPTTGVTSSSGGGGIVIGGKFGVYGVTDENVTRTINPSETISGNLMKMGFTVLPSISSDFLDNTMIVSYGYLDGKGKGEFTAANATIIIQFRDAKTQQLLASYETTGYGATDSESVSNAISAAMELFQYTLNPKITLRISDVYKKRFYLYLTNKTVEEIDHVLLRITYSQEGCLVYEQKLSIMAPMATNETARLMIDRDKQAQSLKMQIDVEVLSYNQ